jgi:hypothetical protein
LSIQITKAVLKDFLTSGKRDVLALTGAWGVGKTFAWNEALKEYKGEIKLSQYCYVSLFGISTMAELRMALFVKSVAVKTIGAKLDLATINEDWAPLFQNLFRKGLSKFGALLRTVPHGSTVSLGLEALAPNFVRDTLICIDDFERQASLKPEDILGLISELKEEKGCKVALIFNAEKLNGAAAYRMYKEKVVDFETLYAPTVVEAFELVFTQDFPNRDLILRHVADLEITNVRILRKLQQIISCIVTTTTGMHAIVLEASIATAVLLCWCAYAPDSSKPKIEEIEGWNKALISFKKEAEEDPATVTWVRRLKAYGFVHVNDLDLAIARIVERGYAEGTGFLDAAQKVDAEQRGKEMSEPFTQVWRRFHGSFSGDTDAFISELHAAALHGIAHIGSGDLNSTVRVLRELGKSDLADDLIDKYIDAHKSQPGTFDLKEHPFGGSIDDTVLRSKFDAVHAGLVQLPGLEESLSFMSRTSSHNPEHLQALRDASVDDYEAVFMKDHDEIKLANLIKWSLRWADSDSSEITVKAREALERIKRTSPLNAIRVARYGI